MANTWPVEGDVLDGSTQDQFVNSFLTDEFSFSLSPNDPPTTPLSPFSDSPLSDLYSSSSDSTPYTPASFDLFDLDTLPEDTTIPLPPLQSQPIPPPALPKPSTKPVHPPPKTKNKRPKKRRKTAPTPPPSLPAPTAATSVTLPRDVLLTLDSTTFENYIKKIAALRDLSPSENKELQRQRRLIKNREAAQASRQRKKDYITKLEEKVSNLTQTTEELQSRIDSLSSQNKTLSEEVLYLRSVIKKNPGLDSLYKGLRAASKMEKEEASKAEAASKLSGTNLKAAGVVLLVLLFSFGLFFSPPNPESGFSFSGSRPRPSIPQVMPVKRNFHLASTRHLLETPSGSNIPHPQIEEIEEVKANPPSPSPPPLSLPDAGKMIEEKKGWNGNTTYLYCPNVSKITPPVEMDVEENEPLMVSLLLPPDSVGDENVDGGLVEVTCRVMSVDFLPVGAEARNLLRDER